jgi:hypothetical protein
MSSLTRGELEIVLEYAERGLEGCAYCDPYPNQAERDAVAKFRSIVKAE